jgi:hypothetical protein
MNRFKCQDFHLSQVKKQCMNIWKFSVCPGTKGGAWFYPMERDCVSEEYLCGIKSETIVYSVFIRPHSRRCGGYLTTSVTSLIMWRQEVWIFTRAST